MSKVSIVVPMYNSEDYLDDCLKTIQNQTYTDIEVLMMNDGSDDNTKNIALKYSETDKRFKYFEHSNMGQGLSRNRGIALAEGDYIAFADSDDIVDFEMVSQLVDKITQTNTDVVAGEIIHILLNGNKKVYRDYSSLRNKIVTEIEAEEFYRDYVFNGLYSPHPVAKLFKTSLLKENNIRFGDNKKMFAEDRYFRLISLLYIKSISFIDRPVYYYIQRDESHSRTIQPDVIKKQLHMAHEYETHGRSALTRQVSALVLFSGITRQIRNIIDSKSGYREFSNIINNYRKNSYFSNKLMDLYKFETYNLYLNKKRKYIILVVAYLEKMKLVKISNVFMYFVQWVKIKKQKAFSNNNE